MPVLQVSQQVYPRYQPQAQTPRGAQALVVDEGFDPGLTHTSTHWEIFLGFTYLLPHRLWPDHRNDRRQAPESYGINGSKPGL